MGKESWQIKLKSDIREYVALKIRERRNEAGMTQGELGVQCNLTRASIANIEKAGQMPPLDILYTIALALDCSPLDLLPPESITSEAMRERDWSAKCNAFSSG